MPLLLGSPAPITVPSLPDAPLITQGEVILCCLFGQSWIAGSLGGGSTWNLADYEQDDQFRNSRIWVKPDETATNNGAWEFINQTANNYVPPGSNSANKPPVVQVASLLEFLFPNIDIYFVQYARGGTGLNETSEWGVNGTLRTLFIEYFLRPALADLDGQGLTVNVLPLVSGFGAADGDTPTNAAAYTDRLFTNADSLIKEIQAELELPLLSAGIFSPKADWTINEIATIRSETAALVSANSNLYLLDAENYTNDETDNLHLSGIGARNFAADIVNKGVATGFLTYSPAPTLTLISAILAPSGSAAGQSITLTYSSALNESIVPVITDFAPNLGRSIATITVTGSTVVLDPDTAYSDSDVVTLSYTPGANPITGQNTAVAAALVNQSVANNLVSTGVIFQTSFTDTAGTDISAHTPPTGTSFTEQNGQMEIGPNGSEVVAVGGSPGGPNWVSTSSPNVNSAVVRVVATVLVTNTSTAGVVLRYQGNDNHLAILIRDSGSDTVRLFSYDPGYSVIDTYAFTPPADDIFTITVEYSDAEVRYQVNAEPVQTVATTLYGASKACGIRLGDTAPTQEIRDYEVSALTTFSI